VYTSRARFSLVGVSAIALRVRRGFRFSGSTPGLPRFWIATNACAGGAGLLVAARRVSASIGDAGALPFDEGLMCEADGAVAGWVHFDASALGSV
jgi:phosphoribosyl 1,2-cyclic phosphodiesterase